MPTYVGLIRWTDQGIKTAKDAVTRYEQQHEAIEKAGGHSSESGGLKGATTRLRSPSGRMTRRPVWPRSRSGWEATSAPKRCGPTPPRRCSGSSRDCPDISAAARSLSLAQPAHLQRRRR